MKLTTFILIVALAQVSARGFGQKITLNTNHTPIEQVLQSIRTQSGYGIVYNARDLGNEKITLRLSNASVEDALNALVKDLPLTYKIVKTNILITRIEPSFLDKLTAVISNMVRDLTVKGKVVDQDGKPLPNASIRVKGKSAVTNTNQNGEFEIKGVDEDAVLVISYIGYKQLEIPVKGATMPLEIKLNQVTGELEEVSVKGNTGYQVIDKNHPGSFDVIDKELLNRRVGANILDRIENLTPGLSFGTPGEKSNDNPYGLLIRGRNSIFSSVAPLIVVDNFPYDGNIDNINPNDVQSVTILKDASAAAIWGARAGNGVIVITTKRGRSLSPEVFLNSNLVIQPKPDLFATPIISSNDAIDVERYLFQKGFYDGDLLTNSNPPPFTPVVELLAKNRSGLLSDTDLNIEINKLRDNDVRRDLSKFFYQTAVNQQYALNVNGRTQNINYYLSGGLDKGRPNLVGRTSNRITLRSQTGISVTKDFEIQAGFNYVQNNSLQGNNPGQDISIGTGKRLYPYASLVGEAGEPLVLERDYRSSFTDTAGRGKILDWKYRPYQDINETDIQGKTRDFLINIGLRYQIKKSLNLELRYQYQNGISENSLLNKVNSYYTRNLINKFYQPKESIQFPIPIGGIMDKSTAETISQQARAQMNYNENISGNHYITALAGFEIKDLTNLSNSYRYYGYDDELSITGNSLDFVRLFPQFNYGEYASNVTATISNPSAIRKTVDRFISYFANASYSFDNRYFVNISARNDAANLFGVKTNQKGVPLWSIGFGWNISNEKFFSTDFISYFKLRASYGYNGNFSRRSTALTTISYSGLSELGLPQAMISTPPNKDLRWEQVRTLNFGLDFGVFKNRLSGSVGYYRKHNKDLMGVDLVDPTIGIGNTVFRNVASIKGSGVELQIMTKNLDRKIKWNTDLIFTYALNKVETYLVKPNPFAYNYSVSITPIPGKPMYGMYSFNWAGLNSTTGNPQGILNGKISEKYSEIINNASIDSMIYNGLVQPPYFGALRNTFSWKNWSLSANISWKFGYYFRKRSLNYGSLYNSWSGHSDFAKRWQNQGDERTTNVPSMVFPYDGARDFFYENSNVLVDKASQIRLEDINLSYTVNRLKKAKIKEVSIYTYINNIGILWVANKDKIDPNLNGAPKMPKSISFGIQITF